MNELRWQVRGYDQGDEEWYDVASQCQNEQQARGAGLVELAKIEQAQPEGPRKGDGFWRRLGDLFFPRQDEVWIIRPDGSEYRLLLE